MAKRTLRTYGGWLLLGGVLACTGMLFYHGAYRYLLMNPSSSASVENTRRVITGHHDATTLVLGDSTAGNAFLANVYNRTVQGDKAVNGGVPGGGLFTAYKIASHARRQAPAVRRAVLILGPDQYKRRAPDSLLRELEYNKTSLEFGDLSAVWEYAGSVREAFRSSAAIAFRPFLYSKDLRHLLLHPVDRLKKLPGMYAWLSRPISTGDPLWEDDRVFSVCGIKDVGMLAALLRHARSRDDQEEIKRLEWIDAGYQPRKGGAVIDPDFFVLLSRSLALLADSFDRVYVVNAPVFSGFTTVYPAEFREQMRLIAAAAALVRRNIRYIPPEPGFEDDCANFLDVVHLNRRGAEQFTRYVAAHMAVRKEAALVLKRFGPDTVRAGQAFNVQADGSSAVWAETENASSEAVLVIGGTRLRSVVQKDGALITAVVPRKLYRKPGVYPVYVVDEGTGSTSQKMTFSVMQD